MNTSPIPNWSSEPATLFDPTSNRIRKLDVIDLSKVEFGELEPFRPATAFALPESDDVWVGYQCDIYVLRDSGIVGVAVNGSRLDWYGSVVKSASNAKQILEAVPSSREIFRFHAMNKDGTSLRDAFVDDDFYADAPGSVFGAPINISKIRCENGLITVTLENTEAFRKGTVWADPLTGELVRATEAGIQTFPNS